MTEPGNTWGQPGPIQNNTQWQGYPPPPPPPPAWAAPPVAAQHPGASQPWNAPPANPWQVAGAPYPYGAGQPPRRRKTVTIVLSVIAAVVAGLIGLGVVIDLVVPTRTSRQSSRPATLPANAATATSPLLEHTGGTAFSDNFTDPTSGWMVGTRAHLTVRYGANDLEAVVSQPYDEFAESPHRGLFAQLRQLRQTATATIVAGSPNGAGWGMTCARDINASAEVHYEFHVTLDGRWYVERRDGVPSTAGVGSILRQGTLATPTAGPLTMTTMCLTLADGVTNRLVLFVGGQTVADLTDVTASSSGGWLGELEFVGGAGASSTIDVSHYDEGSVY